MEGCLPICINVWMTRTRLITVGSVLKFPVTSCCFSVRVVPRDQAGVLNHASHGQQWWVWCIWTSDAQSFYPKSCRLCSLLCSAEHAGNAEPLHSCFVKAVLTKEMWLPCSHWQGWSVAPYTAAGASHCMCDGTALLQLLCHWRPALPVAGQ